MPPEVRELCQRLKEAGHRSWIVGGCVRDALLAADSPVAAQTRGDWDIATSARPEQVTKLFRRVIPTGIQHGTVTVLAGDTHVEVTTFRTEGEYVDGRRPSTVSFHEEIDAAAMPRW